MKVELVQRGPRDRPLVRLYEFDQDEARCLRELVKALSTGARTSVALHDERWVESVNGCRLELRLGRWDEGIRKSNLRDLVCTLTTATWDNIEGLLEPFCRSDAPSFQWLNESGDISLLISRTGRW